MHFLIRTYLSRFCGFLILVCQPLAWAQEDFSDRLEWRTLTSEHFYVHFKHQDLSLAEKSLQYSEQALAQLSQELNWLPSFRIHLVLSNQQDDPNGYATPIPFNYIVIYSPKPADFSELQEMIIYNINL